MIEEEKKKRTKVCDEKVEELDKAIGDLDALKSDAVKKLAEYRKLIKEMQEDQAKDDPLLMDTLNNLLEDCKLIEKEIEDLDEKLKVLKAARLETKTMVDDVFEKPANYTPRNIEDVKLKIDDLLFDGQNLSDVDQAINDDLDKRIEDLKNLKANNYAKKNLKGQLVALGKGLQDEIGKIKDLLKSLPEQIQ